MLGLDDRHREVTVFQQLPPGAPYGNAKDLPESISIDWDGHGGPGKPLPYCTGGDCYDRYGQLRATSPELPPGINQIVVSKTNYDGITTETELSVNVRPRTPFEHAAEGLDSLANGLEEGKQLVEDIKEAVKDAPGKLVDLSVQGLRGLADELRRHDPSRASGSTAAAAARPRATTAATTTHAALAAWRHNLARLRSQGAVLRRSLSAARRLGGRSEAALLRIALVKRTAGRLATTLRGELRVRRRVQRTLKRAGVRDRRGRAISLTRGLKPELEAAVAGLREIATAR
jgi:hypothetical protein